MCDFISFFAQFVFSSFDLSEFFPLCIFVLFLAHLSYYYRNEDMKITETFSNKCKNKKIKGTCKPHRIAPLSRKKISGHFMTKAVPTRDIIGSSPSPPPALPHPHPSPSSPPLSSLLSMSFLFILLLTLVCGRAWEDNGK